MGKVNIAKIFGSDVKDIMRLLNSSGKDCYIVGGAVRDLLLQHKELSDIDLTTPLRVEQLKQIFDINQIKVNDRALKYGSLTIRTQKRSLQITSFRKDIQTFGRSADVAHIENIEEDAKRRDFTINAFYCSYNGEIIDPLGNLKDLNKNYEIQYGDQKANFSFPWKRESMFDLVNEKFGMNIQHDSDLNVVLKELNYKHQITLEVESIGSLIYQLFEDYVEKNILNPTFVIDYPKEVSPFARESNTKKGVTERFELFAFGSELANGFSELIDSEDQREWLQAQATKKAEGDEEAHVQDDDYIEALEYGLPPTGGMGFGIDRFVMMLTNNESIREVIAFPHLKPEN